MLNSFFKFIQPKFSIVEKKGKHNFNKEDHTYINTYLS